MRNWNKTPGRLTRTAITVAALLGLAGCTSLSNMGLDEDLAPSARPVIADNVRSGRLARIGAAQHPRILASYGGEYSDMRLERMVAGIVGRLVTVSDNPSQVYQISILDSPVINAFALPGGYLYVSRGLLAVANDSAELAAVIAHEMAHVTANHGVLRQQREAEAVLASRVVSEVLSDKAAGQRALARGKVALAQFSRNQELEADGIGIAAMGEAGFDPYAAADFQTAMSAFNAFNSGTDAQENSLDFLSTHPSTPQRVSLALGHARKFGVRGAGDRDRQAYLAGIDGMLFGDSPDEGYVRGRTYAHAELGIVFEFPAGFDIENRPEAVLAARASDGAGIRFDGVEVPRRQSLTDYLSSGWVEGLDPSSVRAVTINGLDGATARARVGRWDFDVTVVRGAGQVYRILVAVPVGSGALDALAQNSRTGFRTLSAAEKASLKPLRIRIVRAGNGDTVESLSRAMLGTTDKPGFFRVLNGLEPGEALVVGQYYKTVTH
ncbi:MAG: M48 family metalloprotease [Roseitalea sp.]|jgi:predicted Zn-dependent protease|nr:M48 family metalloprotease [Roseitalea sp.]MBO6721874.1 M48 family metalloprotease [Roseitalea sp.]MBO6744811.1 M48 family metalloprotease [Roseitalea sp.]